MAVDGKNIIMFDVWEVFVLGLMSGVISSGRMDGWMDGRMDDVSDLVCRHKAELGVFRGCVSCADKLVTSVTVSDQKQRIDATSPYMMLGAAGDHVLSLPRQRIAERGRKGIRQRKNTK